jgi:hypothetical protein
MIEVQPVCIPKFDYALFIKAANVLLNKEVSRDIDAKDISPEKYTGLQSLLDGVIRGSECHLYFSFIFKASPDILIEIYQLADLNMSLIGDHGALLSGNLKEWHDAIASYCHPKSTTDARYIYNQVAWYFEQLGFSFNKLPLGDGTWQLAR